MISNRQRSGKEAAKDNRHGNGYTAAIDSPTSIGNIFIKKIFDACVCSEGMTVYMNTTTPPAAGVGVTRHVNHSFAATLPLVDFAVLQALKGM